MKCVICKGTDIRRKAVEEEIKREHDIVLVPMDVMVCQSCGERYYDTKAMRKLEETREQLKRKGLVVESAGKVLRAKVA
jgi:YgiT-type zinc finger domain-containing protein